LKPVQKQDESFTLAKREQAKGFLKVRPGPAWCWLWTFSAELQAATIRERETDFSHSGVSSKD